MEGGERKEEKREEGVIREEGEGGERKLEGGEGMKKRRGRREDEGKEKK